MPDDVKLPAQVQKQEEEADRLWHEQHGKTDNKDEPSPGQAPEAEAEIEPEVVDVEPEPSAVDAEAELQPEPAEPTDYQHKFDVLQGKYDAEVPRLNAENKQLREHSIELGQIIGTLQAEVEKLKTAQAGQQPEVDTGQIVRQFLDEDEMEELQTAVNPKLLGKVIDGLIKSRMQPLEQSVGSVRETQFRTAEDVFWEKVDAIPNMNTINKDPGFNAWLDKKAPYTHLTRRQVLENAQKNLDAGTVVELFNDFIGLTAPKPATTKPTGRKAHISPGKGAGPTSVPAEDKIWTVKEINAFYVDVQKGKYRGKEKERKQKEQEIWNAQRKGNVRRT